MSHPISINGNKVVPANIPSHIPRDAAKTNFILLQSRAETFVALEKVELAQLGVEFLEYVGERTYLCRYEPKDLKVLTDMKYVASAIIYLRELKSTDALKAAVKTEKDEDHYEVDCILHHKPNVTAEELAKDIAKAAGVSIDALNVGEAKIRLIVNQEKLDALAKLDSINRIERVHADGIANDKARGTLLMMAGDSGKTLSSSTYQGEGQIVCIADTGIDLGRNSTGASDAESHPAFEDRIFALRSLYKVDDASDTDGHGTHVCASVCGSGIYKDPVQGDIPIQGTAPASQIMVQCIATPDGQKFAVPAQLSRDLFGEPYDLGIRIHSNSWAKLWSDTVGQMDYNEQATDIDRFVYGSAADSLEGQFPPHEDFIILLAAGNNADKSFHPLKFKSHIGAAAAAKNAITVGACGSDRPNTTYSYNHKFGAIASTGIDDTAVFSSRGPTKPLNGAGGRIKPDVVAPGVAILSAASRALSPKYKESRSQGISQDSDWMFQSGTSMATPLIAGCVAVLREALEKTHGKKHPSAALIKALLVNGAINFSNKEDVSRGYDNEQGFGRVIVGSSIAMIHNGTFVDGGGVRGEANPNRDTTSFDVPGLVQLVSPNSDRWESAEIEIPRGGGRKRLVVTMAYPDLHGGLLQNSINLIVRSGGVERHGNMGKNGGAAFDNTNNVEKVLWSNVPGPTFQVIVQVMNKIKPLAASSFAAAWDLRDMASL